MGDSIQNRESIFLRWIKQTALFSQKADLNKTCEDYKKHYKCLETNWKWKHGIWKFMVCIQTKAKRNVTAGNKHSKKSQISLLPP